MNRKDYWKGSIRPIVYFFLLMLMFWHLFFKMAFAAPARLHLEKYYSVPYCQNTLHGENNGKPVKLSDGTFVDCRTTFGDVEFDFADKFYECMGQMVAYSNIDAAAYEGRHPACVLIAETPESCVWVKRAKVAFSSLPFSYTLRIIGDSASLCK